jgi:hypothetical protein
MELTAVGLSKETREARVVSQLEMAAIGFMRHALNIVAVFMGTGR